MYFIFWNGSIRIFLELFLELYLFSLLNLAELEGDSENEAIEASNKIALASFVFANVIPIIIIIYFFSRRGSWQRDNFLDRVGTFVEGTKSHKENFFWANILVPTYFIMRRVILCLTLVYCQSWFILQLACAFFTSTCYLTILQWDPALISRHAVRLETFNECIIIVLLYHLLCFSDYVESPVTRDYLGWAYICSIGILVLVHLSFLITDMLKKLKIRLIHSYLVCKYRCCRKKAKKVRIKLAP